METVELLRALRQIVREEMTLANEELANHMNARFDHVNTLFEGVFTRLDRIGSIMASTNSGVSP
jgi:hypothetical protein